MANLTSDDFLERIHSIFDFCNANGITEIVLNAGALHRVMGDYPDPDQHRMTSLSNVMRSVMKAKDEVVSEPPKGKGATLSIRFYLPRLD